MYVKLRDLAKELHIKKGDKLFVTSDIKELLYKAYENNDDTDLNVLIDGIIDIIGEEGSLVFPTFNWSFCGGKTFDYKKTPCKTGSLGTLALKRDDFKRTKHPIYSFAVWGKGKDEMCAMENKSSFGFDSPFTYLTNNHYKNLFIDKDLEHSFVYVHYVEEQCGIQYRYIKDFYADYIDEDGNVSKRCYSMNVRDLDLDVTNRIYPFEDEFLEKGIMVRFYVNDLEFKIIDLYESFPIIAEDVRHNRSRRVCSYIGQDSTINLSEGKKMFELCKEIFPINRSITGDGVRKTFDVLNSHLNVPFTMHEVPSGTKVCDWTVPKEWNIEEAYIEDENGNRYADFCVNNLHVLGYSVPVDVTLSLNELKEHIYTLKDQSDAIPYSTSYYKERWGFCMSEDELNSLKDGMYHAVIKSSLVDGSLTYGEVVFPGESEKEVFFTSYTCHPSMANNECSGPSLIVSLINYISSLKNRKYTYRLILAPETIGAITYISKNLEKLQKNVICAYNLTCVGDDRTFSVVHSKYANTIADKIICDVLKEYYPKYIDYSFIKRGSDERQYQAPGVEIPMVCFCRSKYHVYPEYHTSKDNLNIISPDGLAGSFDVMVKCIEKLESSEYDGFKDSERMILTEDGFVEFKNSSDKDKYKITCLCEPQLGRRGLMPTMSSKETYQSTLAMKDISAYADGTNSIEDLSILINQPVERVERIVEQFLEAGLLEKCQ